MNALLADDAAIQVQPIDNINQEDCGTWTQAGARSATVSTVRLQVPGKARGVYQRACGELKKKKFADAERDAQKALDEDKKYPAAWVLLGQAYFTSNQLDRASQACSQASEVDPHYVASYLCLAAVADRNKDWDKVGSFSDRALILSPLQNAYAFYYKADAAFHHGKLEDAKHYAEDAAGADRSHQMPEIQLLLARIYSSMNNSEAAEVQMRNYLKFSHEPMDAATVTAQLNSLKTAD